MIYEVKCIGYNVSAILNVLSIIYLKRYKGCKAYIIFLCNQYRNGVVYFEICNVYTES